MNENGTCRVPKSEPPKLLGYFGRSGNGVSRLTTRPVDARSTPATHQTIGYDQRAVAFPKTVGDAESRTVWVAAGVVLGELRFDVEAATSGELTFAPDPSSLTRATIGVSLTNDACGNPSVGLRAEDPPCAGGRTRHFRRRLLSCWSRRHLRFSVAVSVALGRGVGSKNRCPRKQPHCKYTATSEHAVFGSGSQMQVLQAWEWQPLSSHRRAAVSLGIRLRGGSFRYVDDGRRALDCSRAG